MKIPMVLYFLGEYLKLKERLCEDKIWRKNGDIKFGQLLSTNLILGNFNFLASEAMEK